MCENANLCTVFSVLNTKPPTQIPVEYTPPRGGGGRPLIHQLVYVIHLSDPSLAYINFCIFICSFIQPHWSVNWVNNELSFDRSVRYSGYTRYSWHSDIRDILTLSFGRYSLINFFIFYQMKLLVSCLYLLWLGAIMTSAANVKNCSSASDDHLNSTCADICTRDLVCPSGSPQCKLTSYEKCVRNCRNNTCTTQHCQTSQKCLQECSYGDCERLSCTNSSSCEQVCNLGTCGLANCSNSATCDQYCNYAKCTNLSCEKSTKKCAQSCITGTCDRVFCSDAECNQDCHSGNCSRMVCDNASGCNQDCQRGRCEEMICSNSEQCSQNCQRGRCEAIRCSDTDACKQQCGILGKCGEMACSEVGQCEQNCNRGGNCDRLSCRNATNCTQECDHEECGQLECQNSVHCIQTCRSGKSCVMDCDAATCEQRCDSGLCNMTCPRGVGKCSQSCSSLGTCFFHCDSDDCDMQCEQGADCMVCKHGRCEPLFKGKPNGATSPLTIGTHAWLAGTLLFAGLAGGSLPNSWRPWNEIDRTNNWRHGTPEHQSSALLRHRVVCKLQGTNSRFFFFIVEQFSVQSLG